LHIKTHVGLYINCPLLYSDFDQNWDVMRFLAKLHNIKLMKIHSVNSQVITYTQMTHKTDITNLILVFLQLFIAVTRKIINESIAIKTTDHQPGIQPNSKTSHISNTPEIMGK
jgi:hypothetical protein